jgi:hypothetical protein
MTRKLVGRTLRATTLILLVAACVTAGLAMYCEWVVWDFCRGAERHDGVIVAVNHRPGGYAPLIEFVDDSGVKQVANFTPFPESPPETVGQIRPVLYNPAHPVKYAIESPWIWTGPIVYSAATVALATLALTIFFFQRRTLSHSSFLAPHPS